MLDYLGDLGGLFDALKVIAFAFTSPFSSLRLKVSLMASLFKLSQIEVTEKESTNQSDQSS